MPDRNQPPSANQEDHYRERGRGGPASTDRERDSDDPGQSDWGSQARWGAFGTRAAWTPGARGANPGSYSEEMGSSAARPGLYAGRGPKGWQRPDDRILEEVQQRLTDDARVDASGIEVQVRDGEVTLTGTVEDGPMKRRSEDLAGSVSGVKDIHNRLRLQASRAPQS